MSSGSTVTQQGGASLLSVGPLTGPLMGKKSVLAALSRLPPDTHTPSASPAAQPQATSLVLIMSPPALLEGLPGPMSPLPAGRLLAAPEAVQRV